MAHKFLNPPPELTDSKAQISKPLVPCIPAVDHYAGNIRFVRKALELFTDARCVDITVDLEDGAAVGLEQQRAQELADVVATEATRPVGVRIHPLHSPHWLSDLKIFFKRCREQISHVTIPKAEDPQLTKAAIAAIYSLRDTHFRSDNTSFGVHLLIESPAAIQHINQLASICGVRGLDFGIMDFVSCFGTSIPRAAMRSPDQFNHPVVLAAKTAIVLAARAHGLVAAHNVTAEVKPASVARDDARKARELGFERMWSIHPDQVTLIQQGFGPSTEERELAEKVLKKAEAQQWGPVEVDGVLYDRASYRWLWSLMQHSIAT